MYEIIIGSIIGALTSLIITHFYYRKSSKELEELISNLKNQVAKILITSEKISDIAQIIKEDTELSKKHIVAGTSDDPEFPYK